MADTLLATLSSRRSGAERRRALLGRYPDEESWEGGEVTIAWAGLEPRQHAAAISLGYDARTWDSAFYRAQQQREQMNAAGAAGQGDEMGVEP